MGKADWVAAQNAAGKAEAQVGLFGAVGIVNYWACEHEQYRYTITGIDARYRRILGESSRGWPGGLRWLFGEDM
jgi:hypothetical protein